MTATEFIHELESVRDQFQWSLKPNLGAGAERRAQPRLWVRASPKDGEDGKGGLDPIGAVCYAKRAEHFEPGYWPDAAKALELNLDDGLNIIAATNDNTWKEKDGRRQPDAYLQALRRRLIEAVGLVGPAGRSEGDAIL